jgi:hypothetical protein
MMSDVLSARNTDWIKDAAIAGAIGENTILDILQKLPKDEYTVETKTEKCKIQKRTSGFYSLDIAITSIKTGLTMFVEVKKQHARGNAHERAYKYLPYGGIAQYIRKTLKQNFHSVIVVFTGEMASTTKYIDEIEEQYSNASGMVFLFTGNVDAFTKYVEEEILPRINGIKTDPIIEANNV